MYACLAWSLLWRANFALGDDGLSYAYGGAAPARRESSDKENRPNVVSVVSGYACAMFLLSCLRMALLVCMPSLCMPCSCIARTCGGGGEHRGRFYQQRSSSPGIKFEH